MVEVNQLRKKIIFFIILGRIKQKTKQMPLKGGVATPSTPLLDPPMVPHGSHGP